MSRDRPRCSGAVLWAFLRLKSSCELRSVCLALLLLMQVLQEMLDMLHEHENQVHAARLEIIVIWLIGEPLLSLFLIIIGDTS